MADSYRLDSGRCYRYRLPMAAVDMTLAGVITLAFQLHAAY